MQSFFSSIKISISLPSNNFLFFDFSTLKPKSFIKLNNSSSAFDDHIGLIFKLASFKLFLNLIYVLFESVLKPKYFNFIFR